MKIIILSLALFAITGMFAQVGIGTTTIESSAILQLDATDKALLLPRVTNTAAIITPVNGMLIFDVSQNCIRGYQNGSWTACYASGARAPVAVADTATVLEDASTTSINVIANDTDADGDNLTLVAISTSGGGSIAINADNVSVDYTPVSNFYGTETIIYSVFDGTFLNTSGTLTVTVTSVNDAPVGVADAETISANAELTTIDVISNDTDIEADTLTITEVSTSGSGTVVITSNKIDYTPGANYIGTENISYSISDGTSTVTAIQLVITVINNDPVAIADTLTVAEDAALTSVDVIDNDTDLNGDTLTITAVSTSGTGTITINDNKIDYTPLANFHGTETITYTISDGISSVSGTLTITVTAVNDAPVAVDNIETVTLGSGLSNIYVIANDTDVESDNLTLTSFSYAGAGAVVINNNKIDYTPETNFSGTEIITYTVSDGSLTDTGTLTIIAKALEVGDFKGGGVIAYLLEVGDTGYDASTTHGLIATLDDLADTLPWYNYTWRFWTYLESIVSSDDSKLIGSGAANALVIQNYIASTAHGVDQDSYIFGAITTHSEGGFTDWFVPTISELEKLYLNRVLIGNFDTSGTRYWSSNDYSTNPARVYSIYFSSGLITNPLKNNTSMKTRLIRSF